MEKVLVIKLSALGDIVQAEGAMHDIRLHHKDAEITVLTTPPYAKIMELCPWVDTVIIDPRVSWLHIQKMVSLRNSLRRVGFDIVYDLQQVDRTRLYHRLFLHDTKWMGDSKLAFFHCKRSKGTSAADHFAKHLVIASVATRHTLHSDISWIAADVKPVFEKFELSENFIVLIPGGSGEHPQKRWPFYAELAQKLLDTGYQPVTVPGPDEMELCRNIPGTMLSGDSTFFDYFQLAGVLMKARFVIGNDTGPTHIAAHLRKPGLALFGGHTSPESTGIQHSRFSWIEDKDLRKISLDQVWQRVIKELTRISHQLRLLQGREAR